MPKARWMAYHERWDPRPEDGTPMQDLYESYGSYGFRKALCGRIARSRHLAVRPDVPKCPKCVEALLARTISQGDLTVAEDAEPERQYPASDFGQDAAIGDAFLGLAEVERIAANVVGE